jgi:hypothetical protein
MNENDMDRYFWRTGQRLTGDNRPVPASLRKSKAYNRMPVVVFLAFIVTLVGLVLLR